MKSVTTALIIASLAVQSSVFAAEAGLAQLKVTKGNVLVNTGNGYKAVTGTTNLSAGDRVIVVQGEAHFTNASGCSLNLSSQSILTISKDMKCVATTAGKNTEVVAADLPARTAPPPAYPVTAAPEVGLGAAGIALGLGAAGALIAGIVLVASDGDDTPVSP